MNDSEDDNARVVFFERGGGGGAGEDERELLRLENGLYNGIDYCRRGGFSLIQLEEGSGCFYFLIDCYFCLHVLLDGKNFSAMFRNVSLNQKVQILWNKLL